MSEAYTRQMLLARVKEGLHDIGYQDNLLKEDYRFVDVFTDSYEMRQVQLAAFAHEPPSYRNACFGIVVTSYNEPKTVVRYKALGAPQVLTLHPEKQKVYRWKLRAKDDPLLIESIELDQLHATIIAHKDEWSPEQVLRAKSVGIVNQALQLDFFDAGLIPTLEGIIYAKLDRLLQEVIASSEIAYKEYSSEKIDEKDYKALFRLIFRLIAAKLLGDRNHPGNWLSNNAQDVINEVESFYSLSSEDVLNNTKVQDIAWRKIRHAFSFQNLSVEALAYVYENTCVSATTRKIYGTHATNHTIAEYLVQSLPLDQLKSEEGHIFEPFAGHAPFLVATLQRLRSLYPSNLSEEQRHNYFIRVLAGMEIDAFACEVARCSLILADYPNPNGWLIENDNFFTSRQLPDYLEKAQVVLCNPPYEDFLPDERVKEYALHSTNKAVETLHCVLQFKPKMIGFILPRSFMDSQMYLDARQKIADLYDNVSLVVLPDNAFNFSELETVLLTAYGQRTTQPTWKSAFVKKADFEAFIHTGKLTWQMQAPDDFVQQEIASENPTFWYNPMQPLWDILAPLPHFAEIADIHRGIEHSGPFKENKQNLISDVARPGFIRGLARVTNDFESYITQTFSYINVDPETMRSRTKAHLLPWHQPKVITNAVRLSRGPWTIAATIDDKGLICTQNFHGIWSRDKYPLEVIAAILNGPVANAFISTHSTTKHNKLALTKQIPIPLLSAPQIRLIVSLVREYMSYRQQWYENPERSKYFERLCRGVLRQIDGEILSAYNLSPHFEQQLIEYFDGYAKPGPIASMQIRPSPAKRLYTSLIKVEDIREDKDAKFIEVTIINWDPHQTLWLPVTLIPDGIKEKLERDVWLLARVNVGATRAEDLVFENIELAPEPNDRLA